MTAVGFYHLLGSPLEEALPKLLEKALEKGMRALVVTGSRERAEHLDTVLWTYEEGSFLPHGCAGHARNVEHQPIWLSDRTTIPTAPASSCSSTVPTATASQTSSASSTCSMAAIPKPSHRPGAAGRPEGMPATP